MRKIILFLVAIGLILGAIFSYPALKNIFSGMKANSSKPLEEAQIKEESLNVIPKDFPTNFPIYKNAKLVGVVRVTEDSEVYFEVELETSDKKDKVVEFYKSEIPESDYKIALTSNKKEETVFYLTEDGKDAGTVSILAEDEITLVSIELKK